MEIVIRGNIDADTDDTDCRENLDVETHYLASALMPPMAMVTTMDNDAHDVETQYLASTPMPPMAADAADAADAAGAAEDHDVYDADARCCVSTPMTTRG